jgi:DNA-directed RNA polymerase subunit H
MGFNVLEHNLVPEHHLLSDEEAQEVLAKVKVRKDQLPKIRRSDPCIRALETVHGDIMTGRIVKIVRRSQTADIAVAYRLVVD